MHYHFTSKEEFEKGISEGKFLEYAYVHNNIYGTSLAAVEAVAAAGKCCVLDIDVQGARQVRVLRCLGCLYSQHSGLQGRAEEDGRVAGGQLS